MKVLKIIFEILIFIFSFTSLLGQNTISNAGFETNSALPSGPGQYNLATGWNNCGGSGSPDYFHVNGSGLAILPNCFVGYVNPHSGNAIMGFCPYYPSTLNFREYLDRQLITPLIPGNSYNISFYLTNGIINGSYGGIGIRELGICFSNGALTQAGSGIITAVPQLTFPAIFYDSTWQQISFQYIATAAFDHITIGNFSYDATTTDSVFEPATNPCAYYFIDDMDFSPDSVNAPAVNFTASDTLFCTNNCIDFTDLSNNFPTSWNWSFPGATPSSSVLQNPVNICYQTPGYYSVTLVSCNAAGCDTLTILNFVHSEALPVVNLGNDTTICIPDTVILDAGNGFLTYLWQDGSTNSTYNATVTGIFWVTVNNGLCSNIDSITLFPCNIPGVALMSSDTAFCGKKCIDFTDLSTNNPTSWQWHFPGADSTSSTLQNPVNICYNSYGSFDVTLIACNASGCDTLFIPSFIIEYQLPPQPLITQSNDTLYSTPAFSYAWYNSANPGIIISTDPFYITNNGGSYFVIISDSNGCENSSAIFVATGLHEMIEHREAFYVITDPANNSLSIFIDPSYNLYDSGIKIYNLVGQEIKNVQAVNYYTKIEMELAQSGIYFIVLKTRGSILCKKFVINH